jgi:glycosyltransferase involved in cell wall biosynthesis
MRYPRLRILVLTKRQYTNKDLLDDRFGRLREIPLALASRGHSVRGLCLSYAVREEGRVLDGPVAWKSVNATPLIIPGLLRFVREAARDARTCDVIWACSDSFYGIIGFLLSRATGVPLVFDLYDNFEFFLAGRLPLIKQLYRHVLRNCEAVTCVSKPLAELIRTRGRTHGLHVLENAVRHDLFMPLDQLECRSAMNLPLTSRIIGTAGALDENRGIQNLFQAFSRLQERIPDLHLALAGRRRTTLPIPFHSRVHDLGELALEAVPSFFNALDAAVVCNLDNDFGRYCFPQKAREIMACDVPIVAANVGSMQHLLRNHPEWLYSPNSPVDLARVLEKRLNDRKTGYEAVISWNKATDVLEAVLTGVVSERLASR